MSFYGYDQGEHLVFSLEYSTVLFKKETMERFVDYYKEIISIVSADEEIKLKDIKISHDLGSAASDVFRESDDGFGF